MHRSYIHILNCMRYKHYSTSNPVDVNGHSIANLFPIITQQLFTTNTHPQTATTSSTLTDQSTTEP